MLSQEPWNAALSCTDTWEGLGQKSVAEQHSGWLSDYPSWWGHSAKPELLRVHSVCDLSYCSALIQSLPGLNVKRVVTDKISPEQSGRGMTAALPKGERFPSSSLYCVWLLGESVTSCPVGWQLVSESPSDQPALMELICKSVSSINHFPAGVIYWADII